MPIMREIGVQEALTPQRVGEINVRRYQEHALGLPRKPQRRQAFSDCGLRLSPASPGLAKLNAAIREQLELLAGRPIEKYFVAATNTLR